MNSFWTAQAINHSFKLIAIRARHVLSPNCFVVLTEMAREVIFCFYLCNLSTAKSDKNSRASLIG